MNSDPLPSEGPEREIFLHALQRFSNQCRAPQLIPECPFSVDLPQGGRGCGEECLDILDKYGSPPSSSELRLGSSMSAVPIRGTGSGPAEISNVGRPFDAAEIHLRDSETSEFPEWRTVSLIMELRHLIIPSPQVVILGERVARCNAVCQELSLRGFNVGDLIKYGMGDTLAHVLPLAISVPLLMAAEAADDNSPHAEKDPLPPPLPGWLEILEGFPADDEEFSAPDPSATAKKVAKYRMRVSASNSFILKMHQWINSSSLDALICWDAPTPAEFYAYSDTPLSLPEKASYSLHRWIVDRFTETYLSDWSVDSLRREWRYSKGEIAPPCLRRSMRERKISKSDVAFAIADSTSARDEISETSSALYSVAFQLVADGRVSGATELLRLAVQRDPHDAKLANAFGFCLIPVDAETALRELERAHELGMRHTVNVCDRLFALLRLGKYAALLELAEATVREWSDLDSSRSAVLWEFREDPPQIKRHVCPRCYVREIALFTVENFGDEKTRRRWSDITNSLS